MTDEVDFTKKWTVLRGPYTLFEGSLILEVLDPKEIGDATFFCRATIVASHPLSRLGKKHPIVPPLHMHFDQAESFKVTSGQWGVITGWDQQETILNSDSPVNTVHPMVPHFPWPVPCDEDSVFMAWGHPPNVPEPLTNDFFEVLMLHLSKCYEEKKTPDMLQLMLSQHATRSSGVMLPGFSSLGWLRWWLPYTIQGCAAALARQMGYVPVPMKFLKQ